MFKRLSISLLVMGLAAFGLGAAAFAWFSDSETGQVSIQTGSANIVITANQDCDGDIEGPAIDGTPFPLVWSGIVPGDTTRDCFIVTNSGDGALDVYVKHTGVGGNAALRSAVTFTYDTNADGGDGVLCGPNPAEDFGFTQDNSERGCFLGTVADGGALAFEARVAFPDNGMDQNNLENRAMNMNAIVTGYTG